ncbi:hypothetical protein NSA19_13575 [Actinomyces bowdenii]|uniref:hypothetical protein n=1 Tax=Actinomyces bowdenii TaxID=131109 RepID=UPI00214AD4DD|nr:hypothetical protein [Actinomyces bowdenii]MCR2053847.1 hypothetical protein [Actinomyces bowdenii]
MSKPVDPRIRLAIANWPDDAPRGAVTSFCVGHGISRNTFHKFRRRAEQMGHGVGGVSRTGGDFRPPF